MAVNKKIVKPTIAPVAVEKPINKELSGPVCDCGKPVAPGQNAVCKDHIRVN